MNIDISSSSINRMGIYAAIRVPEVWRFDGDTLTILGLDDEGNYQPKDRSIHFPFLTANDISSFLQKRHELGESDLLRSFRKWVREQQDKDRPNTNPI